jgi:hypothetical protein
VKAYIDKLPQFREKYQKWYSEAQAVVKQVLPDRLEDFTSYFEYPKPRKEISFQNYMIRDYLQGLKITRHGSEVIVEGSSAIPEFVQQLNIVKAAKETLTSTLMDLKAVLQADLFDSELDSARAPAKAGYLRAAGPSAALSLRNIFRIYAMSMRLQFGKSTPESRTSTSS